MQQNEEKVFVISSGIKLRESTNPESNENSPFELDPLQFSSLGQLIRRTAYCLKAASRFLKQKGKLRLPTEIDHHRAKVMWLLWDQSRMYQKAETKNSNVSYSRNLQVITDEDNLIRCKTRLNWAKLQRNEVEPILLAKRTNLTRLIILSIHENNLHAGTAHVLAALRRQYWLPHGRREIFKVIQKNCHTCRRQNAQPFRSPEMAQLPEFRIT